MRCTSLAGRNAKPPGSSTVSGAGADAHRELSLRQDHALVDTVPVRRDHVSRREPDQQFHPAGLRIFAQKDALRAGRIALVVSPFGVGQVGHHGLRQGNSGGHQENGEFHAPSSRPAYARRPSRVLEKCDRKCRARSSPASRCEGGSPAKVAKVANQVGLIVVSAGGRGIHPLAAFLDRGEDALKAADAREVFGRHSDSRLEAPLQLARTDAEERPPRRRHPAERASSRAASSTSASALPRSRSEKRAFDLGQSGAAGQRLQAEIAGSDHAVRQFLHRHTEQLAGAAWPEPDSENAGGAGGAQEERSGKLSREEALRLRLAIAVVRRTRTAAPG